MTDPTPANVNEFEKPITVKLARALAEAIDGLPNRGNPTFVVACYQPVSSDFRGGFMVWGPYRSREEVEDEPRQCLEEEECGFFGPFNVPLRPAAGLPVTKVSIEIDGAGVFDFPRMPDAVFFSVAGVEKFATPYYTRLFGANFAEQMETQFRNANVQVMAHYPWSEYTAGTDTLGRVPDTPVFLVQCESPNALQALVFEEGAAVLKPIRFI